MILNDRKILESVDNGDIYISGFDKDRVNPNSYDVLLGENIMIYTESVLYVDRINPYTVLPIPPDSGCILYPGELYLGVTKEFTKTDKFVMLLEGKSSLARLGLTVHVTAGVGDLGFGGHWTLEMHVIKPLKIFPNIPIAQIIFFESEEAATPYGKSNKGANYTINNQESINPVPQPSKSWKQFNRNRPNLH